MATANLLFPVAQSSIDVLTLDCTLSESHQNEVEVTEHPVEKGSNIADHKRPKPRVVTLDGAVTNTPLAGPADPSRAEAAWQQLLQLKDQAALVDVQTSLDSYENMAITSLSSSRDPRTGQLLRFSVSLKEIVQVSLQIVSVAPKAAASTALGKKPTAPTPAAVQKSSTAVLQLARGVLSAIGK